MKTGRRSVLKKMFASVAGLAGLGLAANAKYGFSEEKEAMNVTNFQDVPLFSGSTKFGNLIFVPGKAHMLHLLKLKLILKLSLRLLKRSL